MRPESKIANQSEQPLITADGFVRLERFEGVLPDSIWSQPDEIFVRWAEIYASVFLPIVTFEIGTKDGGLKGKFFTRSLGKYGYPTKVADGLDIKEYVPYVVEVQNPEQKGLYKLAVHQEPGIDDYLRYKRNGGDSFSKLNIGQIQMFRDDSGEIIGKSPSGKVVLIPRWLPDKVRNQVNEGEEWIGEIREKEKFCFFIPHIKAEAWTYSEVNLGAGWPVVKIQEFNGIKPKPFSLKIFEPWDPEEVKEVFKNLPLEEQAILARLWNIYWKDELARQEVQEAFRQEVLVAQRQAWQAYKEERVFFKEKNRRRMVGMDDEVHTWQRVVVEGEGGGEFEIDIDAREPGVEAWERYKDMKAVTAAEAFLIATDDDRFVSYLREEGGIDLDLGEFDRIRPENRCIDVGRLQAVFKNYKGKSSEEIAIQEFRRDGNFGIDTCGVENDIVVFKLVFVSTLYAREPGKGEQGVERWFSSSTYRNPGIIGDDGQVYEVEYALRAGEAKYKDGYYNLPEHIRDRITEIFSRKISWLREGTRASLDGKARGVSWKKVPKKIQAEYEFSVTKDSNLIGELVFERVSSDAI
jgi:hypothetical protein